MDGTNVSGIGDALSSILSNPELMAKISAIAGSPTSGGQDNASPSIADAPPPGNAAPSGIASVLSDAQILSKLPEVMATIAPLLSGSSSESGGQHEPAEQKNDGAAVASVRTDVPCRAHRTALLCALKPYMSPRRREAIDYIIKIDRIGDLLHTLT